MTTDEIKKRLTIKIDRIWTCPEEGQSELVVKLLWDGEVISQDSLLETE